MVEDNYSPVVQNIIEGENNEYTVTFPFEGNDSLTVKVYNENEIQVTLEEDSDYSVEYDSVTANYSVKIFTDHTDYTYIRISRKTPMTQTMDASSGYPTDRKILEGMLDKLTMALQDTYFQATENAPQLWLTEDRSVPEAYISFINRYGTTEQTMNLVGASASFEALNNGVSVGDPVYISSSGTVSVASADNDASAIICGIATSVSENYATIQTMNVCDIQDGVNIVAGEVYYLGASGEYVLYNNIPEGFPVIPVGSAYSPTQIHIFPPTGLYVHKEVFASTIGLYTTTEDLVATYETIENVNTLASDLADNYFTKTEVNNAFYDKTEADDLFLKKTDAANIYLTLVDATSTYLSIAAAADPDTGYATVAMLNGIVSGETEFTGDLQLGGLLTISSEGLTSSSSSIDLLKQTSITSYIGAGAEKYVLKIVDSTGDDRSGGSMLHLEADNTNSTGEASISYQTAGSNGTGDNKWFTGLNQSSNMSFAFGSSFTDANTTVLLTPTEIQLYKDTTITGSLSVSPDEDITSQIGRFTTFGISNYLYLGYTGITTSTYALRQFSSLDTSLNCGLGRTVDIKANNAQLASFNSTAINLYKDTTITGSLDVSIGATDGNVARFGDIANNSRVTIYRNDTGDFGSIYYFNGSTLGDLGLGGISSSIPILIKGSSKNVLLSTAVDTGERLQVNGTTLLGGNTTITGSLNTYTGIESDGHKAINVFRDASNIGYGAGIISSLRNSVGDYTEYTSLYGGIKDNTDGNESGEVTIHAMKNGSLVTAAEIGGGKTTFYDNTTITGSLDTSGSITVGSTSNIGSERIRCFFASQSATQYMNTNTGTTSSDGFLCGVESPGNGLVWHRDNNFIRFGTNGIERMRISADGDTTIKGSLSVSEGRSPTFAENGYGEGSVLYGRISSIVPNVGDRAICSGGVYDYDADYYTTISYIERVSSITILFYCMSTNGSYGQYFTVSTTNQTSYNWSIAI